MVALDETAFLQVMISRPIVAAPLAGWLMGDVSSGLFLGTILEVFYLDILPAGAAYFPDSGLAAVGGTGVLTLSGKYFADTSPGVWLLVLLVVICSAFIGGWSITLVRRRNDYLLRRVESSLQRGRLWVISLYQWMGLAFSFLRGLVLTFILSSLFLFGVRWSAGGFQSSIFLPLEIGPNLVLCISLALGVRLFVTGRTFIYFVLGAGITLTFLGFGG